jgi:ABC-type Fe3+/spermidine/putrescine transport system ATPase subunit
VLSDPSAYRSVELDGVTKRYGSTVAVQNISLAVERHKTLAVLGPSGCGKTTILRMIAGFVAPDEGSVKIAGAPMRGVRPYERNVGLVFQDYALFPHMTVEQNVHYPLRWRGAWGGDAPAQVTELLSLVRLTGFERRRPSELSGGQQQRVALARALASRPEVLLLDEPLSALDAKLRHDLRIELKGILKTVGTTCIVVTHDQEEAMSLAEDLVVMNQGRIEQRGSPTELYNRPCSRFVAEFIGRSNLFQGVLHPEGDGGLLATAEGLMLRLSDAQRRHGEASICVRPERMFIRDAGDGAVNTISGEIADIVDIGAERQISVALASGRLIHVVEKSHRTALPGRGTPCEVRFPPDACILLPEKNKAEV